MLREIQLKIQTSQSSTVGGEGPNNLDSKQLKIMSEGEVKKSNVSFKFYTFFSETN